MVQKRTGTFLTLTALVAVWALVQDEPRVSGQTPPTCPAPGVDTDHDGVCDNIDNCVADANASQADADHDGVGDVCDACAGSDIGGTVVIGKCDTGVENTVSDDGCTKADAVDACAAGARNHGQFVRCVALLARGWKQAGEINGIGKIMRCAARADIPPGE